MRTILFVLALLGATVGRAQIFLDWYSSAPAAGLLLDDYPNAAAAYSLRLLNSAYTGDCIVVRRSSDNALDTIGFAGGVLDTAALKTFCASTNCFVRTWYDQSSGGWNATQTTDANQPLIVSSGAVNRLNGQPSLFFDGTDVLQTVTLGTYAGVITTFSVFNFVSEGFAFPYVYDQGSIRYILYFDASFIRIYMQTDLVDGGRTLGQQYATYALYNTTSSAFKINTLSYTGSTGTAFQNATLITLGAPGNLFASAFLRGNIQEFVTYRSNQSSNETGIRSNVNTFYNVY